MAKDIQCEVRNIISDIEEKAADGNYIYRGEPECYSPFARSHQVFGVNSNQLLPSMIGLTLITTVIQGSYLRDARQYGGDLYQDDFELASQLQHVGGNTNLIDFTTDYLVALFFACDGAYDKPGRVILLKQTEQIRNKYKIKEFLGIQ